MNESAPQSVVLSEGRFTRFESIRWWDQSLIRNARVLVVGAGALGNEVIKNLSLLGVGNLAIVDMDRVELSNLSRSVLFREEDEGKPKAECAARGASRIYPEISVEALVGNALADVGLGRFRWAQVVVGALDNREARVFVNSACARVGRPWIDGGLDVLQGIARGFAPPATACYECTMSEVDWDLLNKRRSCSLLARRALEQRGTPTTPTIASIIGGIQAQEVIKLLHGMEALIGRGYVFEGATHNSYAVTYPISPDCGWHDRPASIELMAGFTSDTRLHEIWSLASERLGGVDAIDLGREIVSHLECSECGTSETVMATVEKISADRALCPGCGSERYPRFFHSISAGSDLLEKTIAELGLPEWDIVWGRRGVNSLGIEITGDRQ
jgi:adenylyltransferase/sulfurtransferase